MGSPLGREYSRFFRVRARTGEGFEGVWKGESATAANFRKAFLEGNRLNRSTPRLAMMG